MVITWPTVVCEMAVREVKRQCRTLRISAEHNTNVRIADDSPLLSWLQRFAAQVRNKMRIGKDGITSELRRTGRRWRKPMAQFGEKVWFRKIGEDGVSSCASRMTQGNFVGHYDRTGTVLCITMNRVLRCKSWTRQEQKPDRVQYLFLSSVTDAKGRRMLLQTPELRVLHPVQTNQHW